MDRTVHIISGRLIIYVHTNWFFWYPGNTGHLTFACFTKKTRAEKWLRMPRCSSRDLSYETDSGPKTKTVHHSILWSDTKWSDKFLEYDFCTFCKKRRAPKNDAECPDFRAEISHMRPIQGQKLKLCITPFCGVINLPVGWFTPQKVYRSTLGTCLHCYIHFPGAPQSDIIKSI